MNRTGSLSQNSLARWDWRDEEAWVAVLGVSVVD